MQHQRNIRRTAIPDIQPDFKLGGGSVRVKVVYSALIPFRHSKMFGVGLRLFYSVRIVIDCLWPRETGSWTGGLVLTAKLQTRVPALTSVIH